MSLLDSTKPYDYCELKRYIKEFKMKYPMFEVGSIGRSELKRELFYIKLGRGRQSVFYNGTHHSLEWITTMLLLKFAEDYADAYVRGVRIMDISVRELFDKVSIYIVPMVNPDGTELVLNGLSCENPNYCRLIEWNNCSADFSTTWQANNNGVDS